MDGPAGGGIGTPSAHEQALAGVYREVVRFLQHRATSGLDPSARRLHLSLTSPAKPPPPRRLIRAWLADCASERRLVRPSADPSIATDLIAALNAREPRVPVPDRVWGAVVAGVRGGLAPGR